MNLTPTMSKGTPMKSQAFAEYIIWQSRIRGQRGRDSRILTCHSLDSAVYWCSQLPFESSLWIEPVRCV